jgi:hypothetical protein
VYYCHSLPDTHEISKNVKISKFQKHFVNTNMRALALAAIAKLLVACARACMVYAMVYACTVVEVDWIGYVH